MVVVEAKGGDGEVAGTDSFSAGVVIYRPKMLKAVVGPGWISSLAAYWDIGDSMTPSSEVHLTRDKAFL